MRHTAMPAGDLRQSIEASHPNINAWSEASICAGGGDQGGCGIVRLGKKELGRTCLELIMAQIIFNVFILVI